MKKMDWAKRAEIASKELLEPNIRLGSIRGQHYEHIIQDDVEQPKPFTEEEWRAWCKDFAKVPQHGFSEETLKMFEHKEAVENMLMFGDYPGAILGRWTWFDAIRGFFYKILKKWRPRMFSKRKEREIKNIAYEEFNRLMEKHNEDMHKDIDSWRIEYEYNYVKIDLHSLIYLLLKRLGISLKVTPEKAELVSIVEKKKRMRKAVGKPKKGS